MTSMEMQLGPVLQLRSTSYVASYLVSRRQGDTRMQHIRLWTLGPADNGKLVAVAVDSPTRAETESQLE